MPELLKKVLDKLNDLTAKGAKQVEVLTWLQIHAKEIRSAPPT